MKKDIYYIQELFPGKRVQIKKAGGQTNRNYIVTAQKPFDKLGAKKFFVRLPWEEVLDRKVEGKNVRALSQNKKVQSIIPTYYSYILSGKNILNPKDKNRYEVPDGTMITEYIPGKELTMSKFRQKQYQQKLAKLFFTFHTSGVKFVNPYNALRDEVFKYRIKAQKHSLERFFNKETTQELINLERRAQKELQIVKRGVSTHNDIILQNILVGKNKELYLLDFEYAGFNKKGGVFYDIGYMFRDSFFNPPEITEEMFERFLFIADKAYKKKLNRDQLYWSVIAALLVGIWWGVVRYFSVPLKERAYFLKYVQRGVGGALQLAKYLKEKRARVS
jgi:thiamine kinase-like enzyme